MFISFYISSSFEFWSVNHASIYENSELNVFKNIKALGEISSNWPNNLLGINASKTPESYWQPLLMIFSKLVLLQ